MMTEYKSIFPLCLLCGYRGEYRYLARKMGVLFTQPAESCTLEGKIILNTDAMLIVLMIFHIIVTCFMVGIILLQKGEDLGSESVSLRGAGAGQSTFTKLTVIVGAIFMGNCLLLAGLVRLESKVTRAPQEQTSTALPADKKSVPSRP